MTKPLLKKKNILQLVYSGLGGTSAVAFSIVEGYKQSNKLNYVFYFLFGGVERLLNSHRSSCKTLNTKYNFIKKNNFLSYNFLIIKFLINKKFDVIISHDFPLLIYLFSKLINNTKLIFVHHTPDTTKNIKYWFMYLVNSYIADETIVVSKRKKNCFFNKFNSFFLLKPKVVINGINKSFFKNKKIKKSKLYRVGMAARFHHHKYQDLLIKLFHKYKEFFFKHNINLLLAGDGPTKKKLKTNINNYGLNKIISFQGNLDQKSMKKWFNKLNLYIHVSRDETSSTSILQALSSGLPVLASNVGGNAGLRKKFNKIDNIILVENNIDSIFKKMKKIYFNYNLQKKMSISSRLSIEHYFNSKVMFEQYSKFF